MIFNLVLTLSIVLIYCIFYVNNKYDKKIKDNIFLFVTFIILFVVVGYRDFVTGSDTHMYVTSFQNYNLHKWSVLNVNGYFEIGYQVFNILISYLTNSKRGFLLIVSFIINIAVYKLIKENSNNYLLSVIMYINLHFLYSSMNITRQYMALVIVLIAFRFVKEKKLLQFILSIIFATLFHSSAWIALLIYPMYHMSFSHKKVFVIIIISFVASRYVGSIVNTIYHIIGRTNFYQERVGQENIACLINAGMYFLMYLFSYSLIKDKTNMNKEANFYLNTFIYIVGLNLIASNMNVLSRAIQYFGIFSIIALPNLLKIYLNKNRDYIVITTLIASLFIVYSSIIMKYRPEWNTAYNYKSCLIINNGDKCEE